MTEHNLVIKPGDEEIWCECSCGWKIPGYFPARHPKDPNDAWEAWYWPHAIKFLDY